MTDSGASRLKALAFDGAKLRHFGAVEREHPHEDFATCPHPDCVLVRSSSLEQPASDYEESLAVLPDSLERPLVARIGILLENIRRESKIGCELRRELDGGIERDAKAIEDRWPDAAKLLRSHAHIEDGV